MDSTGPTTILANGIRGVPAIDGTDFEQIAAEIKQIISDIIEIPVAELDCNAHFLDDLGIDSLLALEILSALEKRFRIEVPEEDLMQFTTVNKVIEVARTKLGM